MRQVDEILRWAFVRDASDVHLKIGSSPIFRRYGSLTVEDKFPPLRSEDLDRFVEHLVDATQRERLIADRQIDLGYGNEDLGRFRVNIYYQRGELRIALRAIPNQIRTLQDLRMPEAVQSLATEARGLILVTGTTGSGKSTSLASMIDQMNGSEQRHIMTVEDPIEYLHKDRQSMVSQREVGVDVTSFTSGLKGALRQDPDVILIGEMRDLDTIETAVMAAD